MTPLIQLGEPLVEIKNLCVERGNRSIIADLNCSFERGKITSVMGLNGCGKSTLLRVLVGEFKYRGEIRFFCGHDHRQPQPQHIGYVPQKLVIDLALPVTVRDLIGMALQRWPVFLGVSPKVIKRMRPVLERVGVIGRLDVPIDGLSGGQLQRVLLALALEPNPELLLLDEPGSGIDFKDQSAFYDLIAQINRETGVTIVLVSHDLQVLRKHAHKVLCMKNGKIIADGAPATVLTESNLQELYGSSSLAV